MAFTTGSSNATINVTPLIDVLLVLLIIFMVIVPTLPRGLASALPQSSVAPVAAQPLPPLVVELSPNTGSGVRFRVAGHEGDLAQLAPALQRVLAGRADRTVFLRGDKALEFSSVARAVSAFHSAGATEVGILTPGMQQRL